ncbi:MAG: lipid II flippase MurJ, partial [Caldimonas sp.]
CAAALLVFPDALIATLFQHGRFDAQAAAKTALALRGYGVGLIGLIGVKILAPGFYARQDMRTPVTIAIIVLVLTQVMNVAFVPFLGHAGLALSVGLGASINAVWLFIGLRRGGWYVPTPGWGRFTLKIVFATLAMSALLAVAAANIDWFGLVGQEGVRIAWMAACLVAAAAIYFGLLLATGMRPSEFARRG